MRMTSCRHCVPIEFRRSYASVALLGDGDLQASVENVEAQGIVPSVTAVCPGCNRITVILCENGAPYVHVVGVWRRLGPFLV